MNRNERQARKVLLNALFASLAPPRFKKLAGLAFLVMLVSRVGALPPPEAGVTDLDGRQVKLERMIEDSRATVFLFTRTDCPISNRYAPEIRRIYSSFYPRGVAFHLVYVDPDQSVGAVSRHRREFQYPLDALMDRTHQLVDRTGVCVTPEVAVFVPSGELVYRGRIDDRFPDFGRARAHPRERNLVEALEAVLSGKPVSHPRTRAVGCFIQDLK